MSATESTPQRPTQREGSEELTGDIGTAVPAEFDAPATAADTAIEDSLTLAPGSAMLVVKRGPNAGSRFALTQSVMSAGRHPESDIYLDDITVSRRQLKLLVDRREVLVAQRTAMINRLRWRVHELDPERAPKPASLDRAKHRNLLGAWLATLDGLVAELPSDELADISG